MESNNAYANFNEEPVHKVFENPFEKENAPGWAQGDAALPAAGTVYPPVLNTGNNLQILPKQNIRPNNFMNDESWEFGIKKLEDAFEKNDMDTVTTIVKEFSSFQTKGSEIKNMVQKLFIKFLFKALEQEKGEFVEFFLTLDYLETTPLIFMIEHYSDFNKQNSIYDYFDTIIDHLADLNKLNETDKNNNTALIHACNEGLSNIAIKLIITDADTTLRGSLGTARSICEANPKTMATVLSKLKIYGSTKKSRRARTRRRVARRRVARRRATRRSRT